MKHRGRHPCIAQHLENGFSRLHQRDETKACTKADFIQLSGIWGGKEGETHTSKGNLGQGEYRHTLNHWSRT